MKKTKRISAMILLVLILVGQTICYAAPYDDGDKTTYQPDEFTTSGKIVTSGTGVNNVVQTGGKVVGLIRVIGTIASVGLIVVLGIKYMMGSAAERAEYKKTLLPYFIGAVLIFGASNLSQVVYTWASKL